MNNDADIVRQILFSAIERGDSQAFVDLCNENYESIFNNFENWKQVPESVRNDQNAVQSWANSLIVVAEYFASAGYPYLLESLFGTRDDNPLLRWKDSFAAAQYHYEGGEYAESNSLLQQVLTEMEGVTGSGIEEIRPKIYGLLGTNYLRLGETEKSRQYSEMALLECKKTNDFEGFRNYRENIKIINAYNSIINSSGGSAIMQTREAIVKAQQLSDRRLYKNSNSILHGLLTGIKDESAEIISDYRPKIYGLLGLNYYKTNDLVEAKRYTELALKDCASFDDLEGSSIYQENLRIIEAAQNR
jgi:hypothetical protein